MIYFSSDTHFDHKNIITYCPMRPWKTVEEMNEGLIANWNAVVKPEDIVYFLGDFSLSFTAVEKYTKRLNGTKHLYAGNHDKCWGKRGTLKRVEDYLSAGWASVQLHGFIELNIKNQRQEVLLGHLPYAPNTDDTSEGYEPRYLEDRQKDTGKWILHGHVHQHFKIKRKQINVGVDVWDMKPVSIDQIEELIAQS